MHPDDTATTSAQTVRRPATSRVTAGLVAVALVVVGVAVSRLDHPLADPVGDALYAAFVFALLVVIAPRARSATLAIITFAFCAVVELAQLTGVPAAIVDAVPVARYALGTTFVAVDLIAYAVGAALALGRATLTVRAATDEAGAPWIRRTAWPYG